MARASEKIADADLYAYSEDGTPLGIDDRSDAKPTLLLCPPHARHIYVTARIAAGQGFISVGTQAVPLDRARRVEATLHAVAPQNSPAVATPGTIADVDMRLNAHLQALGGHWTPIAQTAVAVDSRIPSLAGIVIDAQSCVDTLVLVPMTVSGLDVEALDESGRTLGRAASTEQEKWMTLCTDEKRALSLQLRPHEGSGTALVLVSRAALNVGRARENVIELGQTLSIEQLTTRVHGQLRARHLAVGKPVARITLTRGVQQRLEEPAEAGCSRYDVFAGAPSSGVQVRVYSTAGEQVASNEGGQHLPLFVCEPGTTTLVFDAQTRGGPILIERTQIQKPGPSLMEYRRAASRFLFNAWQQGFVLGPDELNEARSIPISAKKPWEHEFATGSGHCTDVFASLDGEAVGIGLSRINAETNEPDDGEQHPHSAHLQLCCASSSTECRHRVRVTTNSSGANAIVASSRRP
jgi:hypothetical protein